MPERIFDVKCIEEVRDYPTEYTVGETYTAEEVNSGGNNHQFSVGIRGKHVRSFDYDHFKRFFERVMPQKTTH